MADDKGVAGSGIPPPHPPSLSLRASEADHLPAISSPLNPDATRSRTSKPAAREQREKKDSLKKRENADSKTKGVKLEGNVKQVKGPTVPSPMRYLIAQPKPSDHAIPKDQSWQSHEPGVLCVPGTEQEIKRPVEHAQNTKAYRYSLCVADPQFPHKQWYRSSEVKPFCAHMSIEDSDKWINLTESATIVTNEKGWRMSKANVFARQQSLYYEVKILKGVPANGPAAPLGQETTSQPHIRAGWARREAPLDTPVGFDGYSYGITDLRTQTMHRSRPGRIRAQVIGKAKKVKPKLAPSLSSRPEKIEEDSAEQDEHIRVGDVLGLMITLPSLSLHRKVVDEIYNPAVDVGDGFDDTTCIQTESGGDIIRDRNPVPYRGRIYFEQFEYQPSKPMETYSDRSPHSKLDAQPHPHHEEAPLRTLPGSSIKVFKNGQLLGTAFENLLAFLPPASSPLNQAAGARPGFDDGTLGYYPAVAAFCGGIAEVNFGPDFWCPPSELQQQDSVMTGSEHVLSPNGSNEKRQARPISDRYKEQIAEDIVWDIVDEADFYVQDGEHDAPRDQGVARTSAVLKEES